MNVIRGHRQRLSVCVWRILCLSGFSLGILLAAPFTDAQSTGGRIRGTVIDPSGGAVAGATVTLINQATNASREVQSNANGEYVFIEVPVGTYELDATLQGFKKYVRDGLQVEVAGNVRVDITLEVGSSTESVTVEAAVKRPRPA